MPSAAARAGVLPRVSEAMDRSAWRRDTAPPCSHRSPQLLKPGLQASSAGVHRLTPSVNRPPARRNRHMTLRPAHHLGRPARAEFQDTARDCTLGRPGPRSDHRHFHNALSMTTTIQSRDSRAWLICVRDGVVHNTIDAFLGLTRQNLHLTRQDAHIAGS